MLLWSIRIAMLSFSSLVVHVKPFVVVPLLEISFGPETTCFYGQFELQRFLSPACGDANPFVVVPPLEPVLVRKRRASMVNSNCNALFPSPVVTRMLSLWCLSLEPVLGQKQRASMVNSNCNALFPLACGARETFRCGASHWNPFWARNDVLLW